MLDPPEPVERPPANEEAQVRELTIYIHEENLEKAFDLKIKMTEDEEDRRKSVESKAALLLSSIGLATSLVLGANSFVGTDNYLWSRAALGFVCVVLCVYTLMTVLHAMRCLGRATYHRLSFEDINISGEREAYHRVLLKKMNENILQNQETINEKVNSMVMAQEFYLRSLITIFIYAVLGIALSLIKPSKPSAANAINSPRVTITHDSTAHFTRPR